RTGGSPLPPRANAATRTRPSVAPPKTSLFLFFLVFALAVSRSRSSSPSVVGTFIPSYFRSGSRPAPETDNAGDKRLLPRSTSGRRPRSAALLPNLGRQSVSEIQRCVLSSMRRFWARPDG